VGQDGILRRRWQSALASKRRRHAESISNCVWVAPRVPAVNGGRVEQNETIQKTYPLSGAAPKKVIVDNVNGSIHVTGYAGNEVRLVAHKRLRADSSETAEQARRDVKLDISQDANTVRFYVDGPFRCRDGGIHIDRDPGYEVKYDFELQVPHDTAIDLKTINDGEIKVEGRGGRLQGGQHQRRRRNDGVVRARARSTR
jgi:hypothetical protein